MPASHTGVLGVQSHLHFLIHPSADARPTARRGSRWWLKVSHQQGRPRWSSSSWLSPRPTPAICRHLRSELWMKDPCIFILNKQKILTSRVCLSETHSNTGGETNLPSFGSLPQLLQQPALGQARAGAWNSAQVSKQLVGPTCLCHGVFPGILAESIMGNSNQDLNWHSCM